MQHVDFAVLHDNIATTLTTLVVSYPEICRREARYEEVVREAVKEASIMKQENAKTKATVEVSFVLQ